MNKPGWPSLTSRFGNGGAQNIDRTNFGHRYRLLLGKMTHCSKDFKGVLEKTFGLDNLRIGQLKVLGFLVPGHYPVEESQKPWGHLARQFVDE